MSLSREHILETVREFPDRLTRKDVARRLDIRGEDRRELRALLRDMVESGQLILSSKKTYREAGALPSVMVIRVVGLDDEGDMIGQPDPFKGEGEPPRLRVIEDAVSKKGKAHKAATLGVGGRALCRIKERHGENVALVMKKLGDGPAQYMGILQKDGRGWIIKPVDKKSRNDYRVTRVSDEAEEGTLVMFRATNRNKNRYDRMAEITEYMGSADGPHAATLISLRAHEIPMGFPDEVVDAAKALELPKLEAPRVDLRDLPLITIDPVDAKDFDDAILAMPDSDPKNAGGWVIWVAIADVSAFVRPDSALDREAEKRGNSVYLPDRVEPMLPDELSSDLCSLRPHEDRACMAVKMRFTKDGDKVDHHFTRGMMRSHARLTYAQAQEGFDGHPGETAQTVMYVLKDLYAAYKALLKARKQRAPLNIDLPERRVHVDDKGKVTAITLRERFDAHKLVEEYMVQANVAAAEALYAAGVTTLVRVHEPPKREKLQGLSDFLPVLGLKWALGERPTTKRFNQLLHKASEKDLGETVGLSVLRSQSQAYYGSEASGHFGLNLRDYAHFTSPIRRYADLVVHRALIKAFKLGEGGTSEREAVRLKEIGEHISATERRAMAAERDANDRYIAQYLETKIGAIFDARINGVTKFGVFISLDETGADGLIPVRDLGQEYFIYDEKKQALVGADTGGTYHFGRKVKVKLKEANGITGGMVFDMVTPPEKGPKPKGGRGRQSSGRGRSGGHKKGRRKK